MKKRVVFVALLTVTLFASAQTMKVQSAYSDMKNDRLANAKQNIDEACQNEKTINDPKTWNYAGLIYAQLVDASTNNKKLWKKQKIDTPVEELCATGIAALRKSLELEKKEGTHEYTSSSIEALKVLCGYEFMYAGNVYNDGNYEKAAPMFDKVVQDAQVAGHKDVQMDAMYYQADCYRMLKQPDKELELYRALAKANTDKAEVYLKIYADNKAKGDTTKAINALKKGVKLTANNQANNVLLKSTLASAYIWAKQQNEADKILNEMLSNGENDTKTLNSVANIYVDLGNIDKAKDLFEKSLKIDNNQLDAHRGLGIAYFNKAADGYAEAANIPMDQQAAYDAKMKESNDYFEQCVPYFLDALKIKDNDFASLKALKTAYSKLASRQDIDQAKRQQYSEAYKDVSAKLDKLIQK